MSREFPQHTEDELILLYREDLLQHLPEQNVTADGRLETITAYGTFTCAPEAHYSRTPLESVTRYARLPVEPAAVDSTDNQSSTVPTATLPSNVPIKD